MGYIYKATNVVNGKVYIGQTVRTVEARWKAHLWSANNKNGFRYNSLLHKAIKKYTADSFTIEAIEECDDSLLNEREIYWIDFYHATDRNFGYNIQDGGRNTFDRVAESSATRTKKSEAQMGTNNSFFGKHHTNTHRSCISTPVVSFTDDGLIYKYYVSQIAAGHDGFQQSHITDCIRQRRYKHHGKTPDGKKLKWRNATESESDVIKACFIENDVECLTSQEYQEYCKGA